MSLCAAEFTFGQIDRDLTDRTKNLAEIGKLKNFSSKEIKSSRFGVGFETLDRKVFDPSKVYDKIGTSGLKWARCQTGWARTETQKGVYDFKWLDDVVDNLRERGIQPWFNVGYGNPIYMGKTKNPTAVGYVPLYYGEECLQAWKNYVYNLAKHFKGRVSRYEIWNEPNCGPFWVRPGGADPKEYAKLIKITAAEIRRANPDAKIIACVAGAYSDYLEKLLGEDVCGIIDFVSLHGYCQLPEIRYQSSSSTAYVKNVLALRKSLDGHDGKHVGIIQGESGLPFYTPEGYWLKMWHPSNGDMQAKWMLRRFVTDLSCDIALSSIFMVIDFDFGGAYQTGNGVPHEAHFGFMENGGDYKTRKILDVSKNFSAVFDDSVKPAEYPLSIGLESIWDPLVPITRLPSVGAALASQTFDRNGWPILAYYMPEDLQMRFQTLENAKITGFSGTAKEIKNPVLIDMMTGKVYSAKGASGVPITDYPLLYTDMDAVKDIVDLNK